MWNSFLAFLYLSTWTVLNSSGQFFVEHFSVLICLVSSYLDSSYTSWQGHHWNEVVAFSVHHSRRLITSAWASDVNFNHLVKVVSARCLYCNVTIFLYQINKYFVGRYLRLHNVLFSKFHSLVYIHLMLLACVSYRMVIFQLHHSSVYPIYHLYIYYQYWLKNYFIK